MLWFILCGWKAIGQPPVWLNSIFDVLIYHSNVFLEIGVKFLVFFYFYSFSAEIVVIDNNIAVVIGVLYLLYRLFLILSINADYLVQMFCD